jgi:hypothetical protein
MALNIIWMAFFIIAFIIALVKSFFLGDTMVFKLLADGIFDAAKSSVMDVAFPLAGTMVFFLGLMNVAEKAGAIQKIARWMNPFLSRLFPEVPANHPAMGHMVMNFSANMLGLDNAATPFALKAMESLQNLNATKEKATNAQIMFLVLHTSGLTIIPLSIISYRLAAGSTNAASIFIPCVLATIGTTLTSIIMVGFYQKIKWDKILIGWLLMLFAFMCFVLIGINALSPANKEIFSKIAGSSILFALIVSILVGGAYKKVPVFDCFIEGAKNGFEVIVKIIPYLVAMLVGIRVFRDCGAMDYLVYGITYLIHLMGFNTDFVGALPVAIMRPLSGSGSRALMLDVYKTYGVDSFLGNIASIFQGSADTTFYIIALYFGSVGIKKVRYAIWAGLLADLMGVIIAIIIGYIFFK